MSNVERYTGGGIGQWIYVRTPIDLHEFNYGAGPGALFQVGLFWRWMFSSHAYLLSLPKWLNFQEFVYTALKPITLVGSGPGNYDPAKCHEEEVFKMKESEDVEDIEEVKRRKTALRTPLGRRPLAEPPALLWSSILREEIGRASCRERVF